VPKGFPADNGPVASYCGSEVAFWEASPDFLERRFWITSVRRRQVLKQRIRRNALRSL